MSRRKVNPSERGKKKKRIVRKQEKKKKKLLFKRREQMFGGTNFVMSSSGLALSLIHLERKVRETNRRWKDQGNYSVRRISRRGNDLHQDLPACLKLILS